jgi:hypothetical protein
MAGIAVPPGWEHVPAVGTGIGIQDITNTTAAISPTRGLMDKSVFERFLSLFIPYVTKGTATRNHNAAQLNGSMPSEMCMA